MDRWVPAVASGIALLMAAPGALRAAAECKLERVLTLPVTMSGVRPVVQASIDGSPTYFIIDSGSSWNFLSPAAAQQFNLKARPFPRLEGQGVGGRFSLSYTSVRAFGLASYSFHDVKFLVGGSSLPAGIAGLIGQNLLRAFDVEYDLANGKLNLMHQQNCHQQPLAYWAQSQPFSMLIIAEPTEQEPLTLSKAYVNGAEIHVLFDTGASTSILSMRAAKRAGIGPESAGVSPGGTVSGLGSRTLRSWVGPFESFKLGDEEIKHTRLRFGELHEPRLGDFNALDFDMLLGADFFLSHHIFVVNSQRRLYFTYNGGPVFDLRPRPATAVGADEGAAGSATAAAPMLEHRPSSDAADVATDASAASDATKVAAGQSPQQQTALAAAAAAASSRGTALAARRDFASAIKELSQACELQPEESLYRYQLGMAHLGNGESRLARADFDAALQLKRDDLRSLVMRATLQLADSGQAASQAAAIADLDAADRYAAPQDAIRFDMAYLYEEAHAYPAAITQYSHWIAARSEDVRLPAALAGRCWDRAVLGQELQKARADCDAAYRLNSKLPRALAGRALVRYRSGDLTGAIADYDKALQLDSHLAWALYGRGVAKIRRGDSAAGQTDIAAAEALKPHIGEFAREHDLSP